MIYKQPSIYKTCVGGGSFENVTDKINKVESFDLDAFKSGNVLILFIKINNTLPSFSGWKELLRIKDNAGFKFSGVFSSYANCFYDGGTTPNEKLWTFSNVKVLSIYEPAQFYDDRIMCYNKVSANAIVSLVCPVIDI